ncbi:hypothetical protein J3F83DRAFT_729953 [Trichoderma novae-zelandiae]
MSGSIRRTGGQERLIPRRTRATFLRAPPSLSSSSLEKGCMSGKTYYAERTGDHGRMDSAWGCECPSRGGGTDPREENRAPVLLCCRRATLTDGKSLRVALGQARSRASNPPAAPSSSMPSILSAGYSPTPDTQRGNTSSGQSHKHLRSYRWASRHTESALRTEDLYVLVDALTPSTHPHLSPDGTQIGAVKLVLPPQLAGIMGKDEIGRPPANADSARLVAADTLGGSGSPRMEHLYLYVSWCIRSRRENTSKVQTTDIRKPPDRGGSWSRSTHSRSTNLERGGLTLLRHLSAAQRKLKGLSFVCCSSPSLSTCWEVESCSDAKDHPQASCVVTQTCRWLQARIGQIPTLPAEAAMEIASGRVEPCRLLLSRSLSLSL